jgi:hypothetical protein
MSNETELWVYTIKAKNVLKYVSEAWVLNTRDKQRLETEQMRSLRSLLGYTKLDRQRNVDIRKQLEVQSMVKKIQIHQKNWKEQVGRIQEKRLTLIALKYQSVG